MSEAKHTSGPWQWVFRDRQVSLVHPHRGWLTVLDFVRLGMQGGTCRFAQWKGDERGSMGGIMKPAHEIDVANHPDARLMAAAPEMCEAIGELLAADAAGDVKRLYDAWYNLRVAYAKAKGV